MFVTQLAIGSDARLLRSPGKAATQQGRVDSVAKIDARRVRDATHGHRRANRASACTCGADRLPDDAPVSFAAGMWRAELNGSRAEEHHRECRDRRVWELALAFAMRDALRSGDLSRSRCR